MFPNWLIRKISTLIERQNISQGCGYCSHGTWIWKIDNKDYKIQYIYLKMLTGFEADTCPSMASSNFLFFLGPMAASAVEFAALFRINSSSSCCS